MNYELLETTARQMVREGHGILAADDSLKSSEKRFSDVGLEHTEESRLRYRQVLVSSPTAPDVLSGVILFEETFRQQVEGGQTFPEYLASKGILPGIKLDQGLQELPGFPGEKVTAGLDALAARAKEFSALGARFTKWRNVIAIGDGIPTDECIGANTYILARYARICQENGMVPIVEPEVLIDGNHTAEQAEAVAVRVFDLLFQTLRAFRVHIPGVVMKISMVVPGNASEGVMDANDVAERTVRVLANHMPADLGGVVFLSGGQTTGQAFINLNRIEQKGMSSLPFGVTFSYMRALQDPVLAYWAKNVGDVAGAHKVMDTMLAKIADARKGTMDESDLTMDPAEVKQGFWEY
jgi:fructose-bisphosphate aldolase, class I